MFELFLRSVAAGPDRIALTSGDASVSYGSLRRDVAARAHQLRGLGVTTGSVVGVCVGRSQEMVASLLAVWEAGAAFLPLDPQLPAERTRRTLAASGAAIVVSDPHLAPLFEGEAVRLVDATAPPPAPPPASALHPTTDPGSPAYVIFTSGSTGRPKGVVVGHGALAGYVRWAVSAYPLDPAGVSIVHTSIAFDLTLTSVLCPLVLGMRAVLVREADGPEGLARLLDTTAVPVSLLKMTPSHLALLNGSRGARVDPWPCQVLVLGGEALLAAEVRRWLAHSPQTRVFNEYGPTEATVGCCVADVSSPPSDEGILPIGHGVAGARLTVGGPFDTAECDDGELSIGGPCLAEGYLQEPAATAARFIPDAREAGERRYLTGDHVRRLAGDAGLTFVGRRDRQLKLRGFRVELGEIEACLATYPGVKSAAVLARGGASGEPQLVAFLAVADADARTLQRSALERYLRERLVAPAVPGDVRVVRELPLAPSGKVDFDRLQAEAPRQRRLVDAFQPPRNPTEERIASLWRRVLGIEEIGIDDSFFALDGNSMKSIQFAYLAKKSGLALGTRDLFDFPTIRELAALVHDGAVSRAPEPESPPFALVADRDRARLPPGVVDAYPLAMLQAGTLFESSWNPEAGTYHNVNSYHLEGRLDADALRESLRLLTVRHPILRTSYDFVTFAEPLQLVWRTAEVPLMFERLSCPSAGEQEAELSAFIAEESRRAFDWTRPPLLRFFVHDRGGGRFQLTLSKHHSILDGWSAATLIAELLQNYLSVVRGTEPPFRGAVETRYADFVALERAALGSAEAEQFWHDKLRGLSRRPLKAWPGRKPRPAAGCSAATWRSVTLPPGTAERLKQVAVQAGTPLKSVLLAVHLRVLSRMLGEPEVVTGVVSHGRPETAEADRATGLFINTIPHRARVDAARDWLHLVREAFDEERQAFPHRRYAMARIKKRLGAPPFESIFYFTDFHVFRGLKDEDGLRCVGSAGFEETEIPFTSAFSLHPLTGAVSLRLHFHVDHFSEEQVEAVVAWFERSLAAIATRAEEPLAVSGRELAAPLRRSGPRPPRDDSPEDVFVAFARHARAQGDAVALVSPDGAVSYGALLARAERLAARLEACAAGPGATVAVGLTPAADTIAALLGIACAGACAAVLDPRWPDERLRQVLGQLAPAATVADDGIAGRLGPDAGRLVRVDDTGPRRAAAPVPPTVPAYVVFTSGSTGRPKGVTVSRRSLAHSNQARLRYYADSPYERFLLLSRLTFDSAYAGLWGTLAGGGTLVLCADDPVFDAGAAAATARREAVTHFLAVPSLYRTLLPELSSRSEALRAVIVAGEEVRQDLVAAHEAALPRVRLFNEYGPSEVTVWSTVAELSGGGERAGAGVSIGRAIDHVSAHVLDGRLEPVSPGDPGELYLGGPAVALGYLGAPAATAERFLPNPFATSAEDTVLYRSGDVVRGSLDDDLEFAGRVDNQIKVRGFRVEPEEIETVFHRLFSGREAVVRARGAGLGLYYTSGNGAGTAIDPRVVRAELARVLPAHAVPEEIAAVDALPRLANGKLDRRAELAPQAPAPREHDRPPTTDLERALSVLWGEALCVSEVGVTRSFFEMGGDSLLANRVVLRTDRVFGVRLRLKEFYETPTVEGQAALIDRKARSLGIDAEHVASVWNRLE